jgi:hypothetical protein
MLAVQGRYSNDQSRQDLTNWLIANGVVSTFLATAIVAMAVLASRDFHSVSAAALREATLRDVAVTGSVPSNPDCRVMIAHASAAGPWLHRSTARQCMSKYTRAVHHP